MPDIDALWDALWDDLRHNATGKPSGDAIIHRHRGVIEAEARADAETDRDAAYSHGYGDGMERGRADALREAAERVRALDASPFTGYEMQRAAVLAILDPQP